MSDLCNYGGADSTAVLTDTSMALEIVGDVEPTYYSRCHCGEVTCKRGTYEEAANALDEHRALSKPDEEDDTDA